MATLRQKYSTYEETNLGGNFNVTANAVTPPTLTVKWNTVQSVPTNNARVRLPVAKIGMEVNVKHNDPAHNVNTLQVIPQVGESIDNVINGTSDLFTYGTVHKFVCSDGGDWKVYTT